MPEGMGLCTGGGVVTIKWISSTEEKYWDMLGCVPPASQAGLGFLVGEPYDRNNFGELTFRAFKEQPKGVFWTSEEPVTFKEFKAEFPKAEYHYCG